jgi:predicted flap endonuclease-1-like 5' DNA nuclease
MMQNINVPEAVIEILLLLGACALLGYWIARMILKGKIESLQAAVLEKQAALDDCRKSSARMAKGFAATAATPDDLKIVEGIGPKIEGLLNKEGILTFAQLAATSADRIRAILAAGGPQFKTWDPETWPAQAKLAAEGRMEELEQWKKELNAGK